MSLTKTELVDDICARTGLDRRTVAGVLTALAEAVKDELAASGEVTIPGITKLKTKMKPARKTRLGINPFTRQEQIFKSKPASLGVKAFAVKAVKDAVR